MEKEERNRTGQRIKSSEDLGGPLLLTGWVLSLSGYAIPHKSP